MTALMCFNIFPWNKLGRLRRELTLIEHLLCAWHVGFWNLLIILWGKWYRPILQISKMRCKEVVCRPCHVVKKNLELHRQSWKAPYLLRRDYSTKTACKGSEYRAVMFWRQGKACSILVSMKVSEGSSSTQPIFTILDPLITHFWMYLRF